MTLMLLGATAITCYIVSLLFLRFWRKTHDRFFLFFALSFFVEGCGRFISGVINHTNDKEPFVYTIRLIAFLIILYAIADKNKYGIDKIKSLLKKKA